MEDNQAGMVDNRLPALVVLVHLLHLPVPHPGVLSR
jgi:hypothetical protein